MWKKEREQIWTEDRMVEERGNTIDGRLHVEQQRTDIDERLNVEESDIDKKPKIPKRAKQRGT